MGHRTTGREGGIAGNSDAADDERDLYAMTAPRRALENLDAAQVSGSEEIQFPLRDLDAVIMNAPFTDNRKRGRKFGPDEVKQMQRHELDIRDRLQQRDAAAASAITTNSIRTFFTPLAEGLLNSRRGVLAKVLPVTACTGVGGIAERRFLAERFHVERIVTTHDPRRIAFSENTSIHECLLICRRHTRRRPASDRVRIAAANAQERRGSSGGRRCHCDRPNRRLGTQSCIWESERVQAGDWNPVQWYDGALAEAARDLEENALLEPAGLRYDIGPDGRSVQDAYEIGDQAAPGAIPGFHSVSEKLRRTILASPMSGTSRDVAQGGTWSDGSNRCDGLRNHLLVSMRLDTISGRLTGLWTAAAFIRMVGAGFSRG